MMQLALFEIGVLANIDCTAIADVIYHLADGTSVPPESQDLAQGPQ